MKRVILFLSIILTAGFLNGYGQQVQKTAPDSVSNTYWVEQMHNPDANFLDVQRSFNNYWANRRITKGSGWKVFKRWEYMKQQRADFSGVLPAPITTTRAFYDFKRKAGSTGNVFTGDWKCLGPFNSPGGYIGVGRINAIAFSPTDAQTLYVGAPSGGFWVTHNHGINWTPLTDNLPSLGVSAILIDKTDANTIYLGTGDRDAGDAAGIGVYKSTDGGSSWQQMNTGITSATVGKIIQHPTQSQTLLAATSSGVAITTNGGILWTIKVTGNFQDIQFNPSNPSIVYATASGAFYRSTDAGSTWTKITGFPTAVNRGAIGVGLSDPNVVYFLLSNSSSSAFAGFYKSTDAGASFQLVVNTPNILAGDCAGTETTGQGWYDLAITVEPSDINTVYVGGVNIWKSINGGTSWQVLSGWSPSGCAGQTVHADQHYFGISPINGRLYIGNDGGICYTADKGTKFSEIAQNIPIAQVYKIGQHPILSNLLANGFQDNGSSYYDATNKSWNLLMGGDGMTCAYDPVDNIVYSTLYYGDIYRTNNGIYNGKIAGNATNNITEKGGWVTPFIIDKANSNVMFAGYNNIWRSQNCKDVASNVRWEKITAQTWTKTLNVIKQSTANPKILYYATENLLYRTDDCMATSVNFTTLSGNLPVKTKLITAIETHPTDENVVYIICRDQVFRSADKGLTWVEITLNLPASIYKSCILYNKRINEGLYVGTDAGIYYKDNTMSNWVLFSTGFPVSVEVEDMDIYYDKTSQANDRIRTGTYGRGSWESILFYSKPTAKFTVVNPSIAPNCTVQFQDQSIGIPSTYKWTFSGGTPSTSTAINPVVRYDVPGKWDVKLVVSNSMGADSVTMASAVDISNTIIPTPAFAAPLLKYCASEEPTVTFANSTDYCPTFYQWTVTPNNVQYINGTTAASATPSMQFTQAGKYQVSLKTGNYNGTKTETKTDYIIVQGNKLPFEEQFATDLSTALSWQLSNTKTGSTTAWTIVSVPTPSGDNKALNANFFRTGADGTTRLITPSIDLTGQTNPVLSFKHAYALKDVNAASDSLMVSISSDCGATWTRIFTGSEKGQGTFATHAPTNTEFVPATKDDWSGGSYGPKSFEIDLTPWAGKDNVKLMFEAYSNNGNDLYLDNILVAAGTQTVPSNLSDQVSIYPNPSTGIVNIESKWLKKKFHLDVMNWTGTTIQQHDITPAYDGILNQINLSTMGKGIYYIRITAEQGVFLKKIVII